MTQTLPAVAMDDARTVDVRAIQVGLDTTARPALLLSCTTGSFTEPLAMSAFRNAPLRRSAMGLGAASKMARAVVMRQPQVRPATCVGRGALDHSAIFRDHLEIMTSSSSCKRLYKCAFAGRTFKETAGIAPPGIMARSESLS